MSFSSDFDAALQSLTTFVSAPFVFATAGAIRQPAVQAAIREGYVLSGRMNEAIAEIQETLEDLAAQAQAKLSNEQQQFAGDPQLLSGAQPPSDVANATNRILSTLNKHTHRMTNGAVDLRLLMSIGFATLAIRQLVEKGFDLDDIPWYNLAWYAFDSFTKLNSGTDQSTAEAIAALEHRIVELIER